MEAHVLSLRQHAVQPKNTGRRGEEREKERNRVNEQERHSQSSVWRILCLAATVGMDSFRGFDITRDSTTLPWRANRFYCQR